MHASLQGHSQNSQKNWGVGLIFRVTGPHNWNSIPATMQEISVLFEFTGVARRFKSNFFCGPWGRKVGQHCATLCEQDWTTELFLRRTNKRGKRFQQERLLLFKCHVNVMFFNFFKYRRAPCFLLL